MIPRIIIVGGPNVRMIAAAITSLQLGAAITVVEQTPPIVEVISDVSNTCTNLTAALKRMSLDIYCADLFDTGALDGIRELRDWFQNKVHQVIGAAVQSRRQHRLPIFQPCWSALRWKSLT